jgi:hydrogenase expression/formation protein HypD
MERSEYLNRTLEEIRKYAAKVERATIMEVCGGHTNTIMRFGIRELLPKNIRLVSGPGCPVCVTSQPDIDAVIGLAIAGIPIASYGDAMRVPGTTTSLEHARAHGRVFDVYSTSDVIQLAKTHPDICFFGIGFETTAPMTAFLLQNSICVYSAHKLIPPAMKTITSGDLRIDGFINPGHVSTIIGAEPYQKIPVPQVISGFEPEQILSSIAQLLKLIVEKRPIVVNNYPEAVRDGGNRQAQDLLAAHFTVVDSAWRGLGTIPRSGLEVRNDSLNAKILYKDILAKIPPPKKSACRCADILRGLIEPTDCPLFGNACTPEDPEGACMVSEEGSCAIHYHYRK